MTANEAHLLMAQTSAQELKVLGNSLQRIASILAKTEPSRRDPTGHDVSQLGIRIFAQITQAKQAAEVLEEVLRRNRAAALTKAEAAKA